MPDAWRALLVPLVAALSGCLMGPDYERPEVPQNESYRFGEDTPESIADLGWWELFQDETLKGLIETALENNLDLRAALARIDQASANVTVVRAELQPWLGYGAGGSALETTSGGGADLGGAAALSASWQIDMWGRLRRASEAALQELLATEEAYRGVTIRLVAEVASSYILLRDVDNRMDITEQTIETRRNTLDLVETRYEAGAISEVDLNQAQILLAQAEASLQRFARRRAQTENAIAVLLGSPPLEIPRGETLYEQVFPVEVPAGLPSALLERRPDVLVAERQLAAQTARIGSAEALRFPQLDLTANLGAQFSNGSADLGFLDVGFDLFGPLFRAGQVTSLIEIEKARTEELLQVYRQTVLRAFQDVEDTLIALRTYEAEHQARTRQLDAANNASQLTWIRYEGGDTSYLEVLDVERSRFESETLASEALQRRMTSLVDLYRALGGGWTVEPKDTEQTADPSGRKP